MDKDDELARLRTACQKNDNDIEQILGRALGYPRYCDDQINFPGSTDADGVCVGDQVAATLAAEAADRIKTLGSALAAVEAERDETRAELLVQDAVSAMGAQWLVDLTSLRIKYERQRRTIRALVVVARAMWWAVNHMAGAETIAHFVKLARRECAYMRRLGATSSLEADITGMRLDAEAYETHRKQQIEYDPAKE